MYKIFKTVKLLHFKYEILQTYYKTKSVSIKLLSIYHFNTNR